MDGKFKDLKDKLKEGVSVHEIESFTKKYMMETFFVIALVIGMVSSSFDFFTGPGLTIAFLTLGVLVGIFFPVPVEQGLKQFYAFAYKQEKLTQLIIGIVKMIIGLFVPFILFGAVGVLAASAYTYFIRHSRNVEGGSSMKGKRPGGYGDHN